MINSKKIEEGVKLILEGLGENIKREGIKKTPYRVAKMYSEVFEGMNYTNDEIIKMLDVTFVDELDFNSENIIVIKNISFFSFCEHHLALMYDMNATVAYIPNDRVIGLSKIIRIVELVSKRLQIQERIGQDIAYILSKITNSDNIAVLITGKHSCYTSRGIKNVNSTTFTQVKWGRFQEESNLLENI